MNSFGSCFRITTWGESHGRAVGVVVDGCPAGLTLNAKSISTFLKEQDRPIPALATGRVEPNEVEILSGVAAGLTLGTPISLVIYNRDVRSGDYNGLTRVFRPGHGDYTYFRKYHISGLSGGGRASGRECIARLAAGYIAAQLIKLYLKDFSIEGEITTLAGIRIRDRVSYRQALGRALRLGAEGDSSGGTIKLTIKALPAGIGEPVFNGIDAMVSSALMSIGAVKAVEIGRGKGAALVTGRAFHDEFTLAAGKLNFQSNNSGGVLAGITSGQNMVVSLAVKPTPSIGTPKTGGTPEEELSTVSVTGRHDKNITPRIIPIARAMLALVIVDYLMLRGNIRRDYIA